MNITFESLDGYTGFFLSNIPDIIISENNQVGSMASIIVDGDEIFNEFLYPDSDNNVYLRNVGDLLRPSVYDDKNIFLANVNISVESETKSFRVLYCDATISIDNSIKTHMTDFLNDNFLTSIEVKHIRHGSTEYLTCYSAPIFNWEIDGRIFKNGNIETFSVTESSEGTGFKTSKNVGPAAIMDRFSIGNINTDRILDYTVSVGNRVMKYIVENNLSNPAVEFAFKNAFNAPDTVSLSGFDVSKGVYDQQTVMINCAWATITTSLYRLHSITTGPLDDSQIRLMQEMLMSGSATIDKGPSSGRDVVFSDIKDEISTEDSALNAMEFSFRFADSIKTYNTIAQQAERIFDDSFDNTYN